MYQLLKIFYGLLPKFSFLLAIELITNTHMRPHTHGRPYENKQKVDIHYTPKGLENPLDLIIDISELL